ncbi:tRNA (N(6)-L-threonylcarbamoyladenosine(37)-C(2))-methylthiotransferase MtaB [Porphyromonas sp. COT-108 OH1349]|uniref:tRNA (N(6)-L-threonylcarbamoyladenosine(37)-C(2))- methylthiotransferase MtaB n=1 Tax=Porphyromonas sp. COT-108 OH1349 TaxID=1537504 RepID=UPI00052D3249|nr:tRNA (N(6)-L-threonylcarbamoyladenosine(37)-C(2))-methylthiotransferase MtaB [Porphyromonas sp. COT-108 OH1349]KGN69625.1 Fe-S oxidoreductase [Porphyromonas sp. COT-108 OH1349]
MIDNSIFEYKTAAFFTLGCKLNFAETSAIGRSLLEVGIRKARDGEVPDICVINTCSVTQLADKKSRHAIRKIHRDYPNAKIIVTGCYAQLKPEEVGELEGVDMVLGTDQKIDLVSYLAEIDRAGDTAKVITSATENIVEFAPSLSSEGRTRHFLKVQDGCDYKCSYCTIPKARGKSRNGSIQSIVAQAESVARDGGKEIVLTGVNVGDFGRSTQESFIDLIKALDEVEGIDRFRISSIEPNLITDEVIAFVARSKRFAPHFHIPLQSGSDEVLKLMRRRYNTSLFRHKVEEIKRLMPDAYIGVDVIVGSRGETAEAFEACRSFIESLPISRLHVFSYSERPGTMALSIKPVVDAKEKHKRSKTLLDLSDTKQARFYMEQAGSVRRLLLEAGDDENYLYGYTENYIRLRIPREQVASSEGEIIKVKVGEQVESEELAEGYVC